MNRMISAALAVAFFALVSPSANAQSAREARQEVEASMLVSGHVDIDRSGAVTAYELDQPDKLPPYVTRVVNAAVPSMRFDPVLVDGTPVLARARMSLRVVMSPAGEGEMHLRIASAHFGEQYEKEDTSVTRAAKLPPPRYPAEVARMGGRGTVYLLVKVGRDGSTQDVHAEQVNLTALGNAREMARIRRELAKAAVDHARRRWTWAPPTTGDTADREFWIVRIPVSFDLGFPVVPEYGQWSAYHPGETTRPEWSTPTPAGFRPDAIAAGSDPAPENSRFKLLTPLEG